jgi:hypothetical protein
MRWSASLPIGVGPAAASSKKRRRDPVNLDLDAAIGLAPSTPSWCFLVGLVSATDAGFVDNRGHKHCDLPLNFHPAAIRASQWSPWWYSASLPGSNQAEEVMGKFALFLTRRKRWPRSPKKSGGAARDCRGRYHDPPPDYWAWGSSNSNHVPDGTARKSALVRAIDDVDNDSNLGTVYYHSSVTPQPDRRFQ